MKRCWRLAVVALAAFRLTAQQASLCPASSAACRAFTAYLDAFNRLDWDAFRVTLADDITVLFDDPGPPERMDGRADVETVFRRVFPPPGAVRKPGPPRVVPEAFRWQEWDGGAVASFVMRDSAEVSRRTVVLARRGTDWRVVHIHGSTRSK